MRGIVRSLAMAGRAGWPIVLIVALAQPSSGEAAGGDAKGTLTHKARTPPAALETSADQPKRLAGRLAFDDTPSGGPKVEVEFDAALVKEHGAAR